eukprot:TRINITY_DN3180_c0_g1_i1.p1 TRINITY_DN3180_c0_g1~~TRINITY_DN3180_c0_g1_i1.p1  ORF type:complete len:591 (+),score=119.17 TRINITY_DN3180_c0_g1_i1:221-1774(+)
MSCAACYASGCCNGCNGPCCTGGCCNGGCMNGGICCNGGCCNGGCCNAGCCNGACCTGGCCNAACCNGGCFSANSCAGGGCSSTCPGFAGGCNCTNGGYCCNNNGYGNCGCGCGGGCGGGCLGPPNMASRQVWHAGYTADDWAQYNKTQEGANAFYWWANWIPTPGGQAWVENKRKEARLIVDGMIRMWGWETLAAGEGVVDIGGDPGFLAAEFLRLGIRATVLDPGCGQSGKADAATMAFLQDPSHAEKLPGNAPPVRMINKPFNQEFVDDPGNKEFMERITALVSLYPDEATEFLLSYSASKVMRTAFIPCNECQQYYPPHDPTYQGFVNHLIWKDKQQVDKLGGHAPTLRRERLLGSPFCQVVLVRDPHRPSPTDDQMIPRQQPMQQPMNGMPMQMQPGMPQGMPPQGMAMQQQPMMQMQSQMQPQMQMQAQMQQPQMQMQPQMQQQMQQQWPQQKQQHQQQQQQQHRQEQQQEDHYQEQQQRPQNQNHRHWNNQQSHSAGGYGGQSKWRQQRR